MTNTLAAAIALLVLATGSAAQHDPKSADAVNVTGTWNMGLEGGHVIPVALVLKQDGTTVTGTIALPTQNVGQRVDVALAGKMIDGALTLSGTVEGAKEPTTIDIAGTLNDDGSMEGTMTSPHGKMTWTADRLKERK
jgi:hypothetical protein